MRVCALALGIAVTGPALAEQAALRAVSAVQYLPSEVLFEPADADESVRKTVRLRLVAAELADQTRYGFEAIEPDFLALCEGEGLRIVANFAPNAREVVVSVSSAAVPFGDSVPNVVQYFDVFTIIDGTCVWGGL